MKLHILLRKATAYLDEACDYFGVVDNERCIKALVALRELLNARPELEAGGVREWNES